MLASVGGEPALKSYYKGLWRREAYDLVVLQRPMEAESLRFSHVSKPY